MQKLSYLLTFTCPAFLGNAQQVGQWRTPPIKALLRQWWRVVYAANQKGHVDVAAMRRVEGRIFGAAADSDGNSSKSQVRLRLDRWDIGKQTSWSRLDTPVTHPEVKNRVGRPAPVGAHLYLGYGPLTFNNGTALKAKAAIQASEHAMLLLTVPDGTCGDQLLRALALMNLYGTMGGRSRNGWGSFTLQPRHGTAALPAAQAALHTSPWREALMADWPHAIGSDDRQRPLIWQTASLPDWRAAMRRLAEIKIALRTQFKFTTGANAPAPEQRHWLSYPVTRHSVRAWGANARLPNSLRFKVRPETDGKSLRGVIFHMPCLPPPAFAPDRPAIERVWQQVHQHLDADRTLSRIPA
jgi:CRISPR-associated protein Cmr1